MKIDNVRIKLDTLADYIPGVSTLSNAVDAVQKKVLKADGGYTGHIKSKSNFRIAVGLVPIAGNIVLGAYDLVKAARKYYHQNFSSEARFNDLLEKNGTLLLDITIKGDAGQSIEADLVSYKNNVIKLAQLARSSSDTQKAYVYSDVRTFLDLLKQYRPQRDAFLEEVALLQKVFSAKNLASAYPDVVELLAEKTTL